ncbi:MAG TPA: CDP-alcohol phosphatidyltransferase family protein [Spirochaetota bacterium]|nr:CDP-alcohol phosphatidyltransferase family protein [Spirochaetota bacterium]
MDEIKKLNRKRRVNISIIIFFIWLLSLGIFFFFSYYIKIDIITSILIMFFETLLIIIMWLFFMLKIEWLKDINTGKEITTLNISNFLSAIRYSFVPLLIALFGMVSEKEEDIKLKIVIFIFATIVCLTDLFDGFLARKLNEVTKLGMVLDPVGDFLMITCFSILMFTKGIISLWFFILILIRIPTLLLILIIFLILDIKFKLKTTFLGRATIFYLLSFLGVASFKLFIKDLPYFFNLFLFVTEIMGGILIVLSSIQKIMQLIELIKDKRYKSDKENIQI